MRQYLGLLVCLFATCSVGQYNVVTFHGDSQRLGWISNETILTPANVSSSSFGPIWNSPQLDSVQIGGATFPPHLYASPLFVDSVTMSGGAFAGVNFHVVYAGSSNGFVYAINAVATTGSNPVAAGTILWKRQLNAPSGKLDGGIPLGILGTPTIDLAASPARMYVASQDATHGWQVFAVDITSGNILPGWPLNINNTTLAPLNQNGPTTFQPSSAMSQRGGLNLSPDGRLLYVPFGAYGDGGAGWMVAVDTATASLASAFAGAPSNVAFANGGMWASSGPAVDAIGNVYSTTGNGTTAQTNVPGFWGQSVLVWTPSTPLRLAGTYTPFNYCLMDVNDTDLAGGSVVVLPDLGAANTSTPHLITFGGKQGNQYLVDRDHLPGSLVSRQPCSTDSTTDKSLVPPGPQPQFGKPGPLNVFGPYSEDHNQTDFAKARTTGAFFHAADGSNFIFATGSTKAAVGSTTTVPPDIARLRINLSPGKPAFLSVDELENVLVLLSPGSPFVTSNGSSNPILWVLEANVTRGQSLVGTTVPHPVLYALDPFTLKTLWATTPSMLNVGGKYATPAFAPGMVFVGTDRIQAFGLEANRPAHGVAISCGGAGVGNFLSDRFVTGGHANTFSHAIDVSGVTNPAPQAVYEAKRTGNPPNGGFTYDITGLTVGTTYNVRLHFVEPTVTAAGQRLFNVAINGQAVLTNFDIFRTAGAQFRAVIKEFTATPQANGVISIAYTFGAAFNPLASAIEVIPE